MANRIRPGTLAALSGAIGIVIGAGLFAACHPRLRKGILTRGDFGTLTLPAWFKVAQ